MDAVCKGWKGFAVAGLAGAIALLLLVASPTFAFAPLEFVKSFGPDGTGTSRFDGAAGVAVDQESDAVYVLDRYNGAEVLRFDLDGSPLPFSGSAPYISGHRLTGLTVAPGFENGETQIAVDSGTHRLYVTGTTTIRAFEESGEPAEFTAGPGTGSSEIGGFTQVNGVAVGPDGAIYVSDSAGAVKIYAPSGEPITQFETTGPANLAVDSSGAVYVNRLRSTVLKFTPSESPVTPATTFTPAAEPVDPSDANSVAVDPATNDVYIARRFLSNTAIAVYSEGGALLGEFAREGEEGAILISEGVAVEGSSGRTFVTNFSNVEDSVVEIFNPEVIFEGPPSIESTWVSDLTADSATLRASINPNTAATSYRFEYGLGDCALGGCTSVPVPAGEIGAGHVPVQVSWKIAGLQSATAYHFRVVAENAFGPSASPDNVFSTQGSSLGFRLTDSRVWELVSPADKRGGRVETLPLGIVQAAASGDSLAFISRGSLEADPEGNRAPERSSVLAKRAGDAWASKDLTPRHTEGTTTWASEYKLFSTDLSKAMLEPSDPTPLSDQASEETAYLRTNTEPPTFTPLVTSRAGYANVAPGTKFAGPPGQHWIEPLGANAELTHIVVGSKVAPLVPGAEPSSVYLWHAGSLEPVSELPESDQVVTALLGSGPGSVRQAVSADGSRVFWSSLAGGFTDALFVHSTAAGESYRLDVPAAGASGGGTARPVFQGASVDGGIVFFTDSRQLTADASPDGRDLYRCEVGAVAGGALGCVTLTDLSRPAGPAAGSAEVRDLLPAISRDGRRAYFVADGVLDAGPNPVGATATAGEPNLYLWEEGQSPRFVASLSPRDESDWGQVPAGPTLVSQLTAQGSPDGRYLTFMSERKLTGDDNRSALSEEPVEQVYLYDAVLDRLRCVSCSPFGAAPTGELRPSGIDEPRAAIDIRGVWNKRWVAATLPEPSERELFEESLYQPRAVLDNGRVFFNAFDGLVPGDSNGAWDVYQYEPLGTGDCTNASAGGSVARSGDGCVSLISSGVAAGESAFLDAGASGDDVFFVTEGRLSVLDNDEELDVYDARVNGVQAVLPLLSECRGEACQPAVAPPTDPTPASQSFRGPGNVVQCPKGKRKVQRKGKVRCVRKHKPRKHKQKSQRKRAGKNRGAQR